MSCNAGLNSELHSGSKMMSRRKWNRWDGAERSRLCGRHNTEHLAAMHRVMLLLRLTKALEYCAKHKLALQSPTWFMACSSTNTQTVSLSLSLSHAQSHLTHLPKSLEMSRVCQIFAKTPNSAEWELWSNGLVFQELGDSQLPHLDPE